jgi:hypothetical protein
MILVFWPLQHWAIQLHRVIKPYRSKFQTLLIPASHSGKTAPHTLMPSAAHLYIAVGSEGVLWGLFISTIKVPNTRDILLMAGDVAQLLYFG